ncbi:MAG: T9SS type A sorting domain-containing protein [Flavobacteriales bacterium]|nr:T9SS type A sorting domain-containing protein [Flavobacteriales bacterium]MBK8950336.1 T9SS type A sorting domain-containing protein [Flavobacteriales bacterium]MBK9700986.1 T9SS type A sorting domain-containing protein [Flavobacteriales bacterium]
MKHMRHWWLCFMLMALGTIHAAHAQQPFDLDTAFRTPISERYVNSILPQADGKLILSGRMLFPGALNEHLLVRIEPNGELDPTYYASSLGGGKLRFWNGLAYVGANSTVRRILPNGYVDPSFIGMNTGPYFSSGQGGDYHVYPDGRVLMSGLHVLSDSIRGFEGFYCLVWFTNTGYLDTTQTHRTSDNAISSIHQQPDGKFLLSGIFTTYEGQPVGRIFRVHPDGALDTTFQTDFDWGEANAISVLGDGRILASGYMIRDGISDTLRMIRLMPDGSLDPTFNNDLSAPVEGLGNYSTLRHTLLVDGRIVLHGGFYQVDGEPRSGIAMLTPDGELSDDAFAGGGCGNYFDQLNNTNVHSSRGMALAHDGSWYIHGSYHGYDDGTVNDSTQRFVSRLYGLDVGVQEPQAPWPGELTLHPNPAGTSTTVQFSSAATRELTLVLRDPLGRLVHTERLPYGQSAHSIELTHLPEGVYLISVEGTAAPFAPARLVVSR